MYKLSDLGIRPENIALPRPMADGRERKLKVVVNITKGPDSMTALTLTMLKRHGDRHGLGIFILENSFYIIEAEIPEGNQPPKVAHAKLPLTAVGKFRECYSGEPVIVFRLNGTDEDSEDWEAITD